MPKYPIPKGDNTRLTFLIQAKMTEKDLSAGYGPMLDPSAAKLGEILEAGQAEVADVAESDREYDQAQATFYYCAVIN